MTIHEPVARPDNPHVLDVEHIDPPALSDLGAEWLSLTFDYDRAGIPTDDDEVACTAAFARMLELEKAIAQAPAKTLADVATKLRVLCSIGTDGCPMQPVLVKSALEAVERLGRVS